jgi:hypothetical protein
MHVRSPILCTVLSLTFAMAIPSTAEVVYTPVRVSIPVNSSFNVDLDADGLVDFTLTSKLLQGYCYLGDEYLWKLTVNPSSGNAVTSRAGQIGSGYAAALTSGVPVDSQQGFYPALSTMAELYWGGCGTGAGGEWLNTPNRFLGVRFLGSDQNIHYGWVRLSSVAFVDEHGNFQSSTILSGFAYETIPSQQILTGQTSDAP